MAIRSRFQRCGNLRWTSNRFCWMIRNCLEPSSLAPTKVCHRASTHRTLFHYCRHPMLSNQLASFDSSQFHFLHDRIYQWMPGSCSCVCSISSCATYSSLQQALSHQHSELEGNEFFTLLTSFDTIHCFEQYLDEAFWGVWTLEPVRIVARVREWSRW